MADKKTRSVAALELEFCEAAARRPKHPDPVSRAGNMLTIDHLLDERLATARQ